MNFKVGADDNCAYICTNESDCKYLDAFLCVFIDDGYTDSPFKNVEDAKMFAGIIVKLLKVITNDIE